MSDFWTAPVLNAYQDSISDSNLIPLSSLSLTLFQLASIQPQSSPPPVHNFLPMIGPSAVSVLPDIPLALHALNLSKDSSPLLMPSISSDGKEKAVILAPTHVSPL